MKRSWAGLPNEEGMFQFIEGRLKSPNKKKGIVGQIRLWMLLHMIEIVVLHVAEEGGI